MIPNNLSIFMDRLLPATEKSSIKWQEGAAGGAYFCSHKEINLYISYWYDSDRELGMYTFRIVKEGGDASFIVTDREDGFMFMKNLYSAVELNVGNFGTIADDFFS